MTDPSANGRPTGPRVVDLPERGFVRKYVECFEPTTEAPRQYHVAVAVSLLSLAVGRDAWIELAGSLHLNLYILILGPTTEVRKSTAIGAGKRVLREGAEQFPDALDAAWLLPSGTVSSEALIERLAKTDRALMEFDEFAALLAAAKSKRYAADLKERLTEVYNCWTPGRLARDVTIPPGPCYLNLIAATTRARFESEIEVDDISSGFLGRFLIVYAAANDRVLAWPPAPDPSAMHLIQMLLAEVAEKVRGEITFEDGAKAAITDWYEQKRRSLREADDAAHALPIFFRLDSTVRKLAALFEIAERPSAQIVVSERATRDAIAYADFILGEIRDGLLDGALGDTAQKMRRIVTVVKATPGITKSGLMKKTNMEDPEFTRFTELLEDEGQIEIKRRQGQSKKGRAYRLQGAAGV